MNEIDLCYLPATELIKQFKDKSISPVELMQSMISRAEDTEPVVNAFSHRFFDVAMDQAKKAEHKYATGKRTGPLEGLPVAIKDESEIKGNPAPAVLCRIKIMSHHAPR